MPLSSITFSSFAPMRAYIETVQLKGKCVLTVRTAAVQRTLVLVSTHAQDAKLLCIATKLANRSTGKHVIGYYAKLLLRRRVLKRLKLSLNYGHGEVEEFFSKAKVTLTCRAVVRPVPGMMWLHRLSSLAT